MSNQLRLDMIDVHNYNNTVVNSSKYAQYYHIDPNSQSPNDAVGKPLVHKSALQQTTGEVLLMFKNLKLLTIHNLIIRYYFYFKITDHVNYVNFFF